MIILLTLISYFPADTWAQTPSTFSRAELEQAIVQLYTVFPSTPFALQTLTLNEEVPEWFHTQPTSSADLLDAETAQQDAEMVAGLVADLDTPTFNDLVTHALIDYRRNPEHRLALSAFLQSLAQQAQPRLVAARLRQRAPFLQAMDTVVLAVEWAYTFAFGAGMWNAGHELSVISRTGRVLNATETYAHVLRGGIRAMATPQYVAMGLSLPRPLLIGLGVGAGAAAIEEHLLRGFEIVPLDPIPLLDATHALLARQLAERTVALRQRACAISLRHRLTPAEVTFFTEEIDAIRRDRSSLARLAPQTTHTLTGTDEPRRAALRCLSDLQVDDSVVLP